MRVDVMDIVLCIWFVDEFCVVWCYVCCKSSWNCCRKLFLFIFIVLCMMMFLLLELGNVGFLVEFFCLFVKVFINVVIFFCVVVLFFEEL